MTEWLVRLQGEKFNLEEASIRLCRGDLELREEDGSYYLTSTEFDSMTDSSQVLERAKELLRIVNPALKLYVGDYQPVAVDGLVIRVGEDGKWHRCFHAAGTLTSRGRLRAVGTVVRPEGTAQPPAPPADPVGSLIAIGLRDEKVALALRLMGDPRLVKLYNVLEVIESDVGGERALLDTGWAPKGEIKRFKRTVNSMLAVGEDARHGKEFQPPERRMSPPEAERLLWRILRSWVETTYETAAR